MRDHARIEPIAGRIARSDPASFARWIGEETALDLRPALPRITTPLLVVAGSEPTVRESRYPGIRKSTVAARYFGAPDATITILDAADGFLPVDHPDELATAVETLLSGLP